MLNIVVVPSSSGHCSASWPTITYDPHFSQCEHSGLATRTSTGLVSGVGVLVQDFHEPNEQPVLEVTNRDTVPVPGVLKPPQLPRSTPLTLEEDWGPEGSLDPNLQHWEKLKCNQLLLKWEGAKRPTPTWPGPHQRETKSSWGKQRVLSQVFKVRLSLIYSSRCQKPVVKMGQPVILKMGN